MQSAQRAHQWSLIASFADFSYHHKCAWDRPSSRFCSEICSKLCCWLGSKASAYCNQIFWINLLKSSIFERIYLSQNLIVLLICFNLRWWHWLKARWSEVELTYQLLFQTTDCCTAVRNHLEIDCKPTRIKILKRLLLWVWFAWIFLDIRRKEGGMICNDWPLNRTHFFCSLTVHFDRMVP